MNIDMIRKPTKEELDDVFSCPCLLCKLEKSALDVIQHTDSLHGLNEESPIKAFYNLSRYVTAKGWSPQQIITLSLMLIAVFSEDDGTKCAEDIKQLKTHEHALDVLTDITTRAANNMNVGIAFNIPTSIQ